MLEISKIKHHTCFILDIPQHTLELSSSRNQWYKPVLLETITDIGALISLNKYQYQLDVFNIGAKIVINDIDINLSFWNNYLRWINSKVMNSKVILNW